MLLNIKLLSLSASNPALMIEISSSDHILSHFLKFKRPLMIFVQINHVSPGFWHFPVHYKQKIIVVADSNTMEIPQNRISFSFYFSQDLGIIFFVLIVIQNRFTRIFTIAHDDITDVQSRLKYSAILKPVTYNFTRCLHKNWVINIYEPTVSIVAQEDVNFYVRNCKFLSRCAIDICQLLSFVNGNIAFVKMKCCCIQ